ncbi:MAG: metallophosphoesterase [Phycisphaerae bacterium]
MLVGIFSDTHDNLWQIEQAIKEFSDRKVETVLHAGDIVAPFAAKAIAKITVPVHIIYGNNDGEKVGLKMIFPQIHNGPIEIKLGNRLIAMAHDFSQIPKEMQERADVLVAGHTHQAFVKEENGKLFINPGECGGWLKGRSTIAILDINTLQAQIIDIPL